MKIYRCDCCRYTFRYPLRPQFCPDCGRETVRNATETEVKDFHRDQRILAEEIRLGLYAATG